ADTVDNHHRAADGDVVAFGGNIAFDQLWFQKSGQDLVASIVGTNDRVTVDDWYQGTDNQVRAFTTADGHSLEAPAVENLVQAMAGFNPPPPGQTSLPDALEQQLVPTLAANWK
ncbi:MAG: calcium-binding protein, partial [Alphaproteobacteria bacterium]